MPVSVRTVATKDFYVGAERYLLAQHLQHRCTLHDPPAKRVLGLETDDQDGGSWICRIVRQVMEDATCLRHPRRGDDHHRTVLRVECLRLACVPGVARL